MTVTRVASLWEENQEYLKQHIGRSASERFGARWILMPEAPFPKFNHVSCIRVTDDRVDELIDAGRRFFRGYGLAQLCLMTTPATEPTDLESRLLERGFQCETTPVMVWDGTPIRNDHPQVRVDRAPREVTPLICDLIRSVFFGDATNATKTMVRRGVDVSYDVGALSYVATIDGATAGAGTLLCRGEMGGIYNMCTLPDYRRQGVATAIMAACVADAVALGCTYVGLTPTPLGQPLYEALGFRVMYDERYYVQRFT